jgi:hypothetical protein
MVLDKATRHLLKLLIVIYSECFLNDRPESSLIGDLISVITPVLRQLRLLVRYSNRYATHLIK